MTFPYSQGHQNFNFAPNGSSEDPDFESLRGFPDFFSFRPERALETSNCLGERPLKAALCAVAPPAAFLPVLPQPPARQSVGPWNLAAKIPSSRGCSAREPDAAGAAGSAAPTRRPCSPRKGRRLALSPAWVQARAPTPERSRQQRFQSPMRLFPRSPSRGLPSPRPPSPSRTTFLSHSPGPRGVACILSADPLTRSGNGNRGALVPSHSLPPSRPRFQAALPAGKACNRVFGEAPLSHAWRLISSLPV